MASHLKVALGWSRIQNIIRDHDTFLMRSTAEWMHCLSVVICKIQSSYSTKSYFQRVGRLVGPNGCCLKPLGRWGADFFSPLTWERSAPIVSSIQVLIHGHTTVVLLSCSSRSSLQINITVSPHHSCLLTHIIQSTEVFVTLPDPIYISFYFMHGLLSPLPVWDVCGFITSSTAWLQSSDDWTCPDIMQLWINYTKDN